MDSPNSPRQTPQGNDNDPRVLAWLELRRDLLLLHARLEYLRLMLKMDAPKR
jgi:hypothetical protein